MDLLSDLDKTVPEATTHNRTRTHGKIVSTWLLYFPWMPSIKRRLSECDLEIYRDIQRLCIATYTESQKTYWMGLAIKYLFRLIPLRYAWDDNDPSLDWLDHRSFWHHTHSFLLCMSTSYLHRSICWATKVCRFETSAWIFNREVSLRGETCMRHGMAVQFSIPSTWTSEVTSAVATYTLSDVQL